MTDSEVAKVVGAVREDRLWQRHMDMAAFGATPRGGVNREALTPEFAQARQCLLGWTSERGFTSATDPIGNLFIRRPGADGAAAPVVTGSHLDTQPAGGKFDGAFGVLAALEVLEALSDAGIETKRPIELVDWMNEEGGRFQPTTMGSSVFAETLPLATVLATADREGVTIEAALAEMRGQIKTDETREFGFPMAAYVEAHIEQGPVLEATGNTIGIVTDIQGLRWFQVEVMGEEAHAGTTPRANRKDALAAAVEMIETLHRFMYDESDILRFTVGRLDVSPNTPNTVPARALFTIDFRHPDAGVLREAGDHIEEICDAHSGDCDVEVTETITSAPTIFDPAIISLIGDAARHQKLPAMEMISGATHDAKSLAPLCPSGMIFVPCAGGISHNEAESATPADLAAGAKVLAEAVVSLANR
ncbi:MAG: M20 family metallo-hydrolase [Rhodospirillales bacterium]|nr:M20 family metallo-hydrolase [Rhodospirillales bacterium]